MRTRAAASMARMYTIVYSTVSYGSVKFIIDFLVTLKAIPLSSLSQNRNNWKVLFLIHVPK